MRARGWDSRRRTDTGTRGCRKIEGEQGGPGWSVGEPRHRTLAGERTRSGIRVGVGLRSLKT